MGIKDKKQQMIKEVLLKAGALDSAAIKERVCARLALELDSYPKATYLRHLKELVDENEVILDPSSGKNVYSLPFEESNIIGQKYLQNLGGRIHVPKIVNSAGVEIVHGVKEFDSQEHIFIVCDIKDNFFTVVVHRDALPFQVHLSRIQDDPHKKEKIIEIFGQRTIVLESPIPRVSGFYDEGRTGHLLVKFLSTGGAELLDLGSSNGTAVQKISDSHTEKIMLQADTLSRATIQSNWAEESLPASKPERLKAQEPKITDLPVALSCSSEMRLILFG
jgi:hypothetical protein